MIIFVSIHQLKKSYPVYSKSHPRLYTDVFSLPMSPGRRSCSIHFFTYSLIPPCYIPRPTLGFHHSFRCASSSSWHVCILRPRSPRISMTLSAGLIPARLLFLHLYYAIQTKGLQVQPIFLRPFPFSKVRPPLACTVPATDQEVTLRSAIAKKTSCEMSVATNTSYLTSMEFTYQQ